MVPEHMVVPRNLIRSARRVCSWHSDLANESSVQLICRVKLTFGLLLPGLDPKQTLQKLPTRLTRQVRASPVDTLPRLALLTETGCGVPSQPSSYGYAI